MAKNVRAPSRDPPQRVIDLERRREQLALPTLLAATLARGVGATVQSMRPGRVEGRLSSDVGFSVTVRRVNVFLREKETYEALGLPIPERVLRDIERWERENGIHAMTTNNIA